MFKLKNMLCLQNNQRKQRRYCKEKTNKINKIKKNKIYNQTKSLSENQRKLKSVKNEKFGLKTTINPIFSISV